MHFKNTTNISRTSFNRNKSFQISVVYRIQIEKYEKNFFAASHVRFFVDTWSDGNKQFFFLGLARVIYPQNCPNQACDYWLVTPNQQTLCTETWYLLTAGNYKLASRQLQNNTVDSAMLKMTNDVINQVI